MKKFYLKRTSIIITILSLTCIILGILAIKFYSDIDKYRKDAKYTYDLYLQGISDTEKNMYQEWIDNLGTNEISAYKQGYSDGLTDGEDKEYTDSYDDGYNDGYNESKNKFIYASLIMILINLVFLFSISQKITKKLE